MTNIFDLDSQIQTNDHWSPINKDISRQDTMQCSALKSEGTEINQ